MIVLDDLFVRFCSARSVGVGHDCVSAGRGMPALSVRHVSDVSLEVASCCLARLTRPVIASASSYWVVVCRCSCHPFDDTGKVVLPTLALDRAGPVYLDLVVLACPLERLSNNFPSIWFELFQDHHS